jgi:DnaJ like chaperone protein
MDYYSRLELVHILFGIAAVDGGLQTSELNAIDTVAGGLGIKTEDLRSIRSIFIGNTDQAYNILNVSPKDETEIIKKSYRELANKYHPDKVANLGPEIQKLAEEKFKSINDAYQTIRKERGF